MAKHITKAQLRQIYQAQLFDNDEYLKLLKEFAGIESRPTTEYNHYDENGEFIGSSVDTGNRGAASATGDCGAASATGKSGVALAAGVDCKAKGALGCAICCVERGEWDGETYPIIAIKAAIVDGDSIKPDTWYMLQNGEFTEAWEDG